jgi:hypothetical protein
MYSLFSLFSKTWAIPLDSSTASDEGITNGPSIFAYLVFGPREKPARRIHEARKAQHFDLE